MLRKLEWQSFHPDDKLAQLLRNQGVTERVVQNVIESGYYMRPWSNCGSGGTHETVSDLMYGNKVFSSSFEFDQFVAYLKGDHSFDLLPPLYEVTVRNVDEIKSVLADPVRQRYLSEGSMTFRGQWREYRLKRPIPNPRRAAIDGTELSVMPGKYRQATLEYRLSVEPPESNSLTLLLDELEPNNPTIFADSHSAYDVMRVEQHYASPTEGLDLTFDIDTALFFATHRFNQTDGIARHDRIFSGAHTGVIYCFRFGSPPVRKSEYYIRDFDLFKTYRPERILRQHCALPLIGGYERNIAITEIDCIIRLHPDFVHEITLTPEYMFPGAKEDAFYRKLLDLKERYPEDLAEVVEYSWAHL
jgi:hypothetical protein